MPLRGGRNVEGRRGNEEYSVKRRHPTETVKRNVTVIQQAKEEKEQ